MARDTLDLRGVKCPLSWARAKVRLESLAAGQEADLAHRPGAHPGVLGSAGRTAARERAALGGERAEPRGELVQPRAVEAGAGAARVDELVAVVHAQVDGAEPRARPLGVGVAADHELLALDALDLAPLRAAAAQV